MEEEKEFVPHVPEHPLPKEIQEMKRDDTVCQFCGVSYLIHSEMKALEERVKKAEETMEYYKGSIEREEKLKVAVMSLEEEITKLSLALQASEEMTGIFTLDIQTKGEEIQKLKDNNTNLQSTIEKHAVENTQLKQRLGKFQKLLPTVSNELRLQKENLNEIAGKLKEKYNNLLEIFQRVKKEVSVSCQHYFIELEQITKKLEKTSTERDFLATKSKELQDILTKNSQELKNLKVAVVEVDDLQSKCSKLEDEMNILKSELHKALDHNKKLYRDHAEDKDIIRKKSKEVESCNKKLSIQEDASKHEKQELHSALAERDVQITFFKKVKCDLEKQLSHLKDSESAVKIAASCSVNEAKGLKESLSEAKEELKSLKEEREKMIKSHHIRIEQLRESFRNKTETAAEWQVKLDAMLKQQEERFKKEKDELWQELSQSFHKEMEAEQARHAGELQSWKTEAKAAQNKFRDDVTALTKKHKEEVKRLEYAVADEKSKTLQAKQSDSAVISNLQQKVSNLESRLEQACNYNNVDIDKLTRSLRTTEQELHETKMEAKKLEEKVNSSRQELMLLQETVRQECEERFQLTEALCEARTELLAARHAGDLTRSISGSSLNSTLGHNSKIRPTFNNCTAGPTSTVCAVGFDGGVSARSRPSSRDSPRNRTRIGFDGLDENRKRIAAAMGRDGVKSRNSLNS